MKSLTHKLAVIFLIMTVPTCVIGVNALWSVRTAFAALEANDRALKNLTSLLQSAGETLRESNALQESARQVAGRIAVSQAETSETLRNMTSSILPKANAIVRMRLALFDAAAAERALLLALNMRHLEMSELDSVRETQTRAFTAAFAAIETAKAEYRSRVQGVEEERAWRDCVAALDEWRKNHDDFMADIDALDALVLDLVRAGPLFSAASRKAYDTVFVAGKAAREICESRLEVLSRALEARTEENAGRARNSQDVSAGLLAGMEEEVEEGAQRSGGLAAQFDAAFAASSEATDLAAGALRDIMRRFWYLTALSVVAIAGAVCLGMYLALRISRPVRNIALHMSRLAHGQVSGDVPAAYQRRRDEIGQLARAMQDLVHSTRTEIAMANAMANGDYTKGINLRSSEDQLGSALRSMLATSNTTLRHVGRAVERISAGAQSVSDASRTLSQGAQTSAQALEEINQSVGHVDAQAKENALHAAEANALATDSRAAARRGYDAVTELVTAMKEIQQSGAKIAVVAKLIDDIAFQTNLLALNAAVEAARAGRQGKGFSVVADEVRNLSARSAKAAKETGEMVAAMTDRMRAGAELAVKSDNEFREIVEATSRVAVIFQDISSASDAQSTAVAQIAGGLGQIDGVIQENTQSAGMTAASALQLSREAEELNQLVSRFRLVSGGMEPGERPLLTQERARELLMLSSGES